MSSYACAGLRTNSGQVFPYTVRPWAHDGQSTVMQLLFRKRVEGKPLVSGANQKVAFRLVLKQRVFETSFVVNSADVLDGSERVIYLAPAFTELNEVARK